MTELLETHWLVFYSAVEFLACFLSVFRNIIVILALRKQKKPQKKSNAYIISLAVADLFMGIFVIPFCIYCVSVKISIDKI